MKRLSVRPLVRTIGAVLLGFAVAGVPALSYAQHSHGGGGGGGGHFSGGGGGHFSGGGGHFSGGPHYMGGHGFAGGYAGAHVGYGGAHYAAGVHSFAAVPHYGAGFAAGRYAGGRVFFPGRGFYAGRAWGGGYWGGAFWPRCWFYPGFAWFLPVLPFGYATYWWGGVPYYYVNSLYYTYNPDQNGYVATEPPPAAGNEEAPQAGSAVPGPGQAGVPGGSDADLFVYPRNGQSDQQMSNDRYECHSWAAGQTGFDPTRSGGQSGNPADYRRAIVACLDARGYSAR